MRMLISILLIVLMAGIGDTIQAAANRPVAALKDVVGIVKIQRSDSRQSEAASVGNLLFNGDRINTSEKASVALLFIDGSLLKIQEGSEVTINAVKKGERELDTKVDLPLGEVWAKVTRRDSKFDIETPSSVASVKGTEFSVSVDQFGTSNIFVMEGLVEFQNEMGLVMVRRNQKSTAIKDQPPEEPKKLTKKDKKELEETKPDWQIDIKKPAGAKAPNQSFDLQIKSLNMATSKVDLQCNERISVSSPTGGAQFSLDGSTWAREIEGQLTSGTITIMAKSRANRNLEVVVAGDNCRPGRTTVEIQKTRQQKRQEADKAASVVNKAGVAGIEGLEYSSGEVKGGSSTLDDVLSKIDGGELEIVSYEVVEGADGTKKVVLRVRPKKPDSGGPGGQ
ncbi:MAG: FecR domain-containing protein [FCB group bacterium]|nr:FecR domain-containing protein [FCB group bacterium]